MKRLILAAALAVSASVIVTPSGAVSSASAPADDEAARPAIAVVDAFHAALGSGDAEAVLALPADMAFTAATTAEVTRRAAWVEGDVAWVLTEGRTTGAFNGRPVDRLTAETMILNRDGDVWRIRHIHWSSRAPR